MTISESAFLQGVLQVLQGGSKKQKQKLSLQIDFCLNFTH